MTKEYLMMISSILIAVVSKGMFKEPSSLVTATQIEASAMLDSLINVYIAENRLDGCYSEIYIDRQRVDYTILTFRTVSNIPLQLKEKNPLFYLRKDNNTFLVYNGMEEYFTESHLQLPHETKACESSFYWYVADSAGVITIHRDFSYPFFPLPEKPSVKFGTAL